MDKQSKAQGYIHLKVKPLYDREFKNSLWGYNLSIEIDKALKEFERQFPIVRFSIMKPTLWNSPGNMDVASIPYSVLYRLKRGSPSSLFKDILTITQNRCGVHVKVKHTWHREFVRGVGRIEGKVRARQAGYIQGFTARLIDSTFMKNLSSSSESIKADLFFGFTGKLCRVPGLSHVGECGYAELGGRHCVIGIVPNPTTIILHELGHMLGAEHSNDKNSVMFYSCSSNAIKFDKNSRGAIVSNVWSVSKSENKTRPF